MALKNYVNYAGPVIDAAWLNQVDLLVNALTGNAGNLGAVTVGPPLVNGPTLTVKGGAFAQAFNIQSPNGSLNYDALTSGFGDLYYTGGPGNVLRLGPAGYANGGLSLGYTDGSSVQHPAVSIAPTGAVVFQSPTTANPVLTLNGSTLGTAPLLVNYSSSVPSAGGGRFVTSNNSLVQPLVFWNQSNGPAAIQCLEMANDTVGSFLELVFWHTSTGFTGSIAGISGLGVCSGISFGQPFYITHGPNGAGLPTGIGINTNGNITMNAPLSGVPLTINSTGATPSLTLNGGVVANALAAGSPVVSNVVPGGNFPYYASDGTLTGGVFISSAPALELGTSTNHPVTLFTNGSNRLSVFNGLTLSGATGGDQGVGSVNAQSYYTNGSLAFDSGTFTPTYTGFSSNPTMTCQWRRAGNIVALTFAVSGTGTGTSNTTGFTLGNLPASITPNTTQNVLVDSTVMSDNGSGLAATAKVDVLLTATSSSMTFRLNNSLAGWTASSTKGFLGPVTITYAI